MAIERLVGSIQTTPLLPTTGRDTVVPSSGGFGESLGMLVGAVEQTNADANQNVTRMLDGTADVHDAMIALQRADLTLQFTVQVRNKLLQAYQEIMRMSV